MSYSSPPNIISTPNLAVSSFTGTTSATANTAAPLSPTSLLVRGFIIYNNTTGTAAENIYIQDSDGLTIFIVDSSSASPPYFFGSATVDLSKELFTTSAGTSSAYTVVYWQ